jgi:DNA-binding transcriptional MerR regulator
MTHSAGRLDDEDYPAITMGQAAELLGVQPAFLRSLDTGGVLHPARTGGGHRRYSRRQLRRAARLRELLDEGHPLAAAQRIAALEDELSASDDRLRATAADLDERSGELAAAHRALETARDRIAELER